MRPGRYRAWAAALVALVAPAVAGQAAIYRCGDSYSQTPCANAKAIDVVAAPTDAQRAEARAVAARERQLAVEMARARHERERALPAAAGSLGPSPVAHSARDPAGAKKTTRAKKRAVADEDRGDFVAAVPKARR